MKRKSLLVLLTYLLIHLSAALFALVIYKLTPATEIQALVYSKLICLISGTLYILNLLEVNILKVKKAFKTDLKLLLAWVLIGVVATVLIQWVTILVENNLFQMENDPVTKEHTLRLIKNNWLAILSPVLFAPLLEEIVFRKVIFSGLYSKTNFFVASIVSSVIFALAHFNLVHLITYTVIGMVLSYLYAKTNRLIVPIMVHITLNAIPVIALLIK